MSYEPYGVSSLMIEESILLRQKDSEKIQFFSCINDQLKISEMDKLWTLICLAEHDDGGRFASRREILKEGSFKEAARIFGLLSESAKAALFEQGMTPSQLNQMPDINKLAYAKALMNLYVRDNQAQDAEPFKNQAERSLWDLLIREFLGSILFVVLALYSTACAKLLYSAGIHVWHLGTGYSVTLWAIGIMASFWSPWRHVALFVGLGSFLPWWQTIGIGFAAAVIRKKAALAFFRPTSCYRFSGIFRNQVQD